MQCMMHSFATQFGVNSNGENLSISFIFTVHDFPKICLGLRVLRFNQHAVCLPLLLTWCSGRQPRFLVTSLGPLHYCRPLTVWSDQLTFARSHRPPAPFPSRSVCRLTADPSLYFPPKLPPTSPEGTPYLGDLCSCSVPTVMVEGSVFLFLCWEVWFSVRYYCPVCLGLSQFLQWWLLPFLLMLVHVCPGFLR